MSSYMSLHATREKLDATIYRVDESLTLSLGAGDGSVIVFLTESQLDELSKVLTDAIAERVDCEECDGFGHIIVGHIEKSETTPYEELTDPCETCDGRGWVLPEKDDE